MKNYINIKKLSIVLILFFFKFNNLYAEDRVNQLDKLFNDLKIDNSDISYDVEQKIWKIF